MWQALPQSLEMHQWMSWILVLIEVTSWPMCGRQAVQTHDCLIRWQSVLWRQIKQGVGRETAKKVLSQIGGKGRPHWAWVEAWVRWGREPCRRGRSTVWAQGTTKPRWKSKRSCGWRRGSKGKSVGDEVSSTQGSELTPMDSTACNLDPSKKGKPLEGFKWRKSEIRMIIKCQYWGSWVGNKNCGSYNISV